MADQSQSIESVLELLQSPTPEYSPATAASEGEGVPVPSSSAGNDSLFIPQWTELTHAEALDKLCVHADFVVEFAADELHKFWTRDSMHATFEMFAPTWLQAFKDHTLVNALSADPRDVPTGYCL
eukprot:1412831-Amphidinium_carterae.1